MLLDSAIFRASDSESCAGISAPELIFDTAMTTASAEHRANLGIDTHDSITVGVDSICCHEEISGVCSKPSNLLVWRAIISSSLVGIVKIETLLAGVEIQTALFKPFESWRHANKESSRKEKENAGSGRKLGIWLPKNHGFQPYLRSVNCFYALGGAH